ncbi:MAG: quaternary ammonium transporter, partial [Roseiflexus sp.]
MVQSIRFLLAFTTLVGLVLAACSAPTQPTSPTAAPQPAPADTAPVRIGSKNFTEAILVAEMYALALEDAGI